MHSEKSLQQVSIDQFTAGTVEKGDKTTARRSVLRSPKGSMNFPRQTVARARSSDSQEDSAEEVTMTSSRVTKTYRQYPIVLRAREMSGLTIHCSRNQFYRNLDPRDDNPLRPAEDKCLFPFRRFIATVLVLPYGKQFIYSFES